MSAEEQCRSLGVAPELLNDVDSLDVALASKQAELDELKAWSVAERERLLAPPDPHSEHLISRGLTPGAWIRKLLAQGLTPAGPIRVIKMPRRPSS